MTEIRNRNEEVREATKRQIVGVLTDTTNSFGDALFGEKSAAVDGSDENHVSLMIEDLTRGLNRKIDAIKLEMMECKQEQHQTHFKAMMKIPKTTREMTVREFDQKYNCNLLDLLQYVRANAVSHDHIVNREDTASIKVVPATICGKRDRFETPAAFRGRRPVQTPATVRTVRRGEMVL